MTIHNTPRPFRLLTVVATAAVVALVAAACAGSSEVAEIPPVTSAVTVPPAAPDPVVHPCDFDTADIVDGFCLVDGRWWVDDGEGNWVESDGPPTTTTAAEVEPPATAPPEEPIPEKPEQETVAAPVTSAPAEPCPAGEHSDGSDICHPDHDDVTATTTTVPAPAPATTLPEPAPTTTTTVPEPAPTTTTTTTEPAPTTTTTTTVPEPAPTTTVPSPDAGTSDDTESVDEYVWVAPHAGYVPPVHPDTPAPSWEQGTFAVGYQPPDRPRVSEEVQKFMDWCGAYFACDPMLLQMKWALDYLGAAESCIMPLYYTRTLEIEAAGHYLTSGELAERFAWYRCPTVVDPRTPTVTEPAVKVQFPDREVLLLTPNEMSMAERCKTVLPEDVELEWAVNNQLDQLRTGLDCYEWGAFVEATYKGNNSGCLRSARLLREWVEHHYGMPIRYWRAFC